MLRRFEFEDAPRVRWTEEARRQINPWRGARLVPPSADDRTRLWKELGSRYRRYQGAWERGLSHASEPCARWIRAAAENLTKRDAEGALAGPLDVDEEAALAVLLGVIKPAHYYYSGEERAGAAAAVDVLVDEWARAAGLAFALRALVRSGPLLVERGPKGGWTGQASYFDQLEVWLQESTGWGWALPFPSLRALRRAAAAADEASYAAARAEAELIRNEPSAAPGPAAAASEVSLLRRCALAYAFPSETAWAHADAEDWLRSNLGWHTEGHVLVAAALDRDTMERIISRTAQRKGHGALVPLLPTLVDHLGVEAGPLLAELVATSEGKVRRDMAGFLALVESPPAAAALSPCLTDKDSRAIASRYFMGAPRLALRTLLPLAAKQDEQAEAAASVAMSVLGTHPDAAEAVRAGLGPEAVKALEALRARIAAPAVEASAADLPPVLARPPWLAKAARKPGTLIEGLSLPERPERLEWKPGERQRLTAPTYGMTTSQGERFAPGKPETDAEVLARIEERQSKGEPLFDAMLEALTDEPALRLWNATAWKQAYISPIRALARLGTAALPGLIRLAEADLTRSAEALSRVDSPLVAPPLAEALVRYKSLRPLAREWLLTHPETAAVGLIPAAVGPHGKVREAAGAALRLLASVERHADTIHSVAARYGKEAAEAVDEVLAFDPLLLYPAKLPKLPEFWNPEALPRPVLLEGKALPLDAVGRLGTMLAFPPVDPPYAGIAQVKAACEPRSLAAFAWELFQQWLLAGAPAKEKWAFLALGRLGDDQAARRLTGLLRDWSSEAYSRAVMGLDVLALFGTDTALRLLFGLAAKAKRGLRNGAEEKVQEVATRRGLTPEDLADRLVPDLDLEPDGSMLLDFGPRSFRVGFDEQLRPYVEDGSGKRLKELPGAAAADGGEKAKAAAEAWKSLKKATRTLAAEQVRRLERAMCTRRRWDAEDFLSLLVAHPLLVHLVRRIVWATFDGERRVVATFRLCEDGTFADSDDRPFTLPDDATVGIPHMLELAPEPARAWGQVLGDYEVLQPFVQIGREVHLLADADRPKDLLDAVNDVKAPLGRVLGLERRGWRKGPPESRGIVFTFEKPLPEQLFARVGMVPGMGGAEGMPEEQTMRHASVHLEYGPRVALGELDPVVYSELVADLLSLKG